MLSFKISKRTYRDGDQVTEPLFAVDAAVELAVELGLGLPLELALELPLEFVLAVELAAAAADSDPIALEISAAPYTLWQ